LAHHRERRGADAVSASCERDRHVARIAAEVERADPFRGERGCEWRAARARIDLRSAGAAQRQPRDVAALLELAGRGAVPVEAQRERGHAERWRAERIAQIE